MKISININEAVADTEVNISCNQLTPEIEKIAKITYSQQIYLTFADLENSNLGMENGSVLAGNFLVAVVLFFVIYKKGEWK